MAAARGEENAGTVEIRLHEYRPTLILSLRRQGQQDGLPTLINPIDRKLQGNRLVVKLFTETAGRWKSDLYPTRKH